ncbi:uncharacterized protein LOC130589970 [Beta vulgaris subsp. vulgaris]|uniref:uncharacterized protein LOC130589970 n=1 Tax=Beta vulgaris subsp. vulgaris TaxID=3555 RepID=UPI0025497288|nr:uncharacterized protein LOC130589970 [Beta vulgaris subsp. vulgaris]
MVCNIQFHTNQLIKKCIRTIIMYSKLILTYCRFRYDTEKLAHKRVAAFRSCPFAMHSSIAVYNAIRTRLSKLPTIKSVHYCRLVAHVRRIESQPDEIIYEACNRCLRKLVITQTAYKCVRCNLTNAATIPRLMLRLIISDKSGKMGVTLMNDLTQHMLRCTPTEIKSLLQQPNGRAAVFNKVMKVFGFKEYSWFLHPPSNTMEINQFHTVDYIFEVDWADEYAWIFKNIS